MIVFGNLKSRCGEEQEYKKSEDYAGMGQGDELCKRNTKRLG